MSMNWIYETCHFMCVWVLAHVISYVYESWHISHSSSWAELIDTDHISHELNWHMSHFSSWPNKKACCPSQIISLQLSTIGIRWTTMAEAQLHVPQYPCIFCNKEVRPHKETKWFNIQVRLVLENKITSQEEWCYRMVQSKVLSIWDDYTYGKISASQLLNACSKLVYIPE